MHPLSLQWDVENEHSINFQLTLPVLFNSKSLVLFPPSLSLSHSSALYCPWRVVQRFNSSASPLWLWINVHHTETGKEGKYNFWTLSLLIFVRLQSGRTREFAPQRVWSLDMAWNSKVMRDVSYILHGSLLWKSHSCFWLDISWRCQCRLRENRETAAHKTVKFLHLKQLIFQCFCQMCSSPKQTGFPYL